MNKKLIIANWKSHKTLSEATEWLKLFKTGITGKDLSHLRVGIAPSFPYLSLAKTALTEESNCFVVAQDISQFPHGKYTGAVNGSQLKSLGVTHVLV
ncbi:MAG TPA: triose-phosphate isomerase, partial [Candidatus Woesebacteria bacterium]|nr:triose-phosphate isomerase [Candidatus Woesebacteria bacterium]